jgi:uncharacterized protein (TIGR03086 family)
MDALTEYGDAIRRNIDRVQAVRADQLAGPTPCHDWDVTALLAHLIGGHEMFAAALGQPLPPAAADPSVTALATRYRDAAAASLDAFAAPGALQRVVALPIGAVPGEVALGLALTDAVVHGWDLAAATGQDTTIDDRVAGPLLAAAQASITDDLRQPAGARAVFAQPVPIAPESPAGDRLVAFLGRSPQSG